MIIFCCPLLVEANLNIRCSISFKISFEIILCRNMNVFLDISVCRFTHGLGVFFVRLLLTVVGLCAGLYAFVRLRMLAGVLDPIVVHLGLFGLDIIIASSSRRRRLVPASFRKNHQFCQLATCFH